jgi:hypothetical protein
MGTQYHLQYKGLRHKTCNREEVEEEEREKQIKENCIQSIMRKQLFWFSLFHVINIDFYLIFLRLYLKAFIEMN